MRVATLAAATVPEEIFDPFNVVKLAPDPLNVVAEKVPPLNVKVDASSNSPEVPAITTLPEVKSETLAVEATNPEPPEISAPPLASIEPVNVESPATLKSVSLSN